MGRCVGDRKPDGGVAHREAVWREEAERDGPVCFLGVCGVKYIDFVTLQPVDIHGHLYATADGGLHIFPYPDPSPHKDTDSAPDADQAAPVAVVAGAADRDREEEMTPLSSWWELAGAGR